MRGVLNLGEIVAAHARLTPQKIGARDSRRALTFAQWNARACRLANALLGLGLKKGDRVALLAYNRVEWMEIYVALAQGRAGGGAGQLPPRGAGDQLHRRALRGARIHRRRTSSSSSVEGLRGELAIPRRRDGSTSASRTPPGWTDYEALIAARIGRRARRGGQARPTPGR